MSLALYRKYRSRSLDEVLGQDHIVDILNSALKKQQISHAYLLTGPRGTGKTSVARILAHQINQLNYDESSNHLDIIEIDAASNTGVDHIRDLREKALVAPTSATYKVYIIDEVHMLSKQAFNALLKTLEEPPRHVVFILATTDVDKLPATIISRVQQFVFHPISDTVISQHLINIAAKEDFQIANDAAELIAEHSKGGFRDAITLLDQLSPLADSKTPLTRDQVVASLGLADESLVVKLLELYQAQDNPAIAAQIELIYQAGVSPQSLISQLISVSRRRLIDNPKYPQLIQRLIDIDRQHHTDLGVLLALLSQAPQAPAPTEPVAVAAPEPTPPETASKVAEPTASYSQPAVEQRVEEQPPTETASSQPTTEFSWGQLLEKVKTQSPSLFGFLSKCSHQIDSNRLTVSTGQSFVKRILDDPKNSSLIAQTAHDNFGRDIEIIVKQDQSLQKPNNISSVISLMGGGEVVDIKEPV